MPKFLIYTLLVMVVLFFVMPFLTSIIKIALFAGVVIAGYYVVKRLFGDGK